jgi:hypothetical protein
MTSEISKIESDIVNVAKKIQTGIEAAGEDALKVTSFLQKNSVEITKLAALAGKQGANVETVGVNLISQVAAAIKAGGTAAGASGLSVTFDAAVIADVKSLVEAIEAV